MMRQKMNGDFFEKADELLYRHKGILYTVLSLAALVFVLIIFEDSRFSVRFTGIIIFIAIAALILLALMIHFTVRTLVFNGHELVITTKTPGIKIKERKYEYETICKFIIARNYNYKLIRTYSLYIDKDDELLRLISIKSYKECLDIMDRIKTKTNKLVYDATDEDFIIEEDLFRSYYKMKKTLQDIKNG